MIRSIFITSLCIMLSFATGCEINRAIPMTHWPPDAAVQSVR